MEDIGASVIICSARCVLTGGRDVGTGVVTSGARWMTDGRDVGTGVVTHVVAGVW